jgi:hypothetical protein
MLLLYATRLMLSKPLALLQLWLLVMKSLHDQQQQQQHRLANDSDELQLTEVGKMAHLFQDSFASSSAVRVQFELNSVCTRRCSQLHYHLQFEPADHKFCCCRGALHAVDARVSHCVDHLL